MAPKLGFGTTFKWNNETVAKLTGIGGIKLSRNMVDVTTHQSSDSYEEVLPGLIKPGTIPLEGFFEYTDTSGQQAMLTDFNAGTERAFVITLPAATGASWSGNAYISEYEIGKADKDGAIPFTASITINGKPTFAIATVTGMSDCGFSNDVLMMPAFAIGEFEYVVTITNGQTTTVVTPVDASGGEIITITANGVSQTVTTGEASSAIAVAADAITDIVIVISHASKASKTYVFHCAVLAA